MERGKTVSFRKGWQGGKFLCPPPRGKERDPKRLEQVRDDFTGFRRTTRGLDVHVEGCSAVTQCDLTQISRNGRT